MRSMGLRDDIQRAMEEALKGRQAEVLGTLRVLWSSIRTEEIDARKEFGDAEIIAIVGRHMKQLKDALADFAKGGRTDLVEKTEREIRLFESYVPKQLSDEEIRAVLSRIITASGASGAKDIGKVMGVSMKEMKGVADGNRVRQMLTELLRD